ncbi:two-component sensor histidine kinase [Catellatospora sp. TT07R-123]|uniref:sensor histidine kinase n=1 Tax=Catellatospora sp. TT07R-123 TaxID=2733863 RepID=UPI001B11308D|nr:HAMP domain-containing sensor histidine kinase [Catellatospora sp. TT07R-123]GHJ46543.1 two-component sensor histidine kinase [Catellatospora sp. TT07R-123]
MPDRRTDLTVPIRVLAAPPRPVRSATTLTTRAVAAGLLVALISVLVTALVAVPLAARAAERAAREGLAVQTDVVALILKNRRTAASDEKLMQQLRKLDDGTTGFLITGGAPDRTGLPDRVVRQIAAGQPVSERLALVDGSLAVIEGRPLGDGDGVVLARPAGTGLARQVLRNLWLPLLAGLGAGVLAGVLLGRRLARPIRNAATAAARLSSGDRAVRLHAEPPLEVERLAQSINELAEALATSEGRQREFLLSISHELRTPLTTIRGYAEALSDGVVDADAAPGVGQTMLAEAERLDRLVADLLSLARLDAADFPIEPAQVELVSLVRSAERAFAPRVATAGVLLHADVPPHEVWSYTDPVRLRQIIDGLVENALRVVPQGRPIVLGVREQSGRAVVEVRDGGPGLSDDDLAVAFQRGALFQRYQGVRQTGTGLGLALVAGLARRLGGTIEAGHAAEGGARFTVYLPRTSG